MPTCPTCRTHYDEGAVRCTKDGETLLPDEAFGAADAPLRPGDMVGEYRIEGKLGEGGFGTVYKGLHPLIGKRCAIKTLHRQFSSNPQIVSRFIAEARAVNQIRHRNIIDIFSFGSLPDGRQYYLMELLDGMPLDRYLAQEGHRLPPERALPILRPIARALDAAHAAGIAHRDLKPENIYITVDDDGVPIPKLLDFGIAKLLNDGISGHKTRTGQPMGTPYYMSPEQSRGTNVDHRTDVYAYGVLCHVMLTGRVPFEGEALMDVLLQHMSSPPPPMSEQVPGLPPQLDAPVLHMLAKSPDGRPQSVGAAYEELAHAAQGVSATYRAALPNGAEIRVGDAKVVTSTGPTATPTMRLGSAKTIAVGQEAPQGTFTPAASDIGPSHGGKRLAIGVGVTVVLATVAAVVFIKGGTPPQLVAAPTAAGASPAAAAVTALPPAADPSVVAIGTAVAPVAAAASPPRASIDAGLVAQASAAPPRVPAKPPAAHAKPAPGPKLNPDLEPPDLAK